MFGQVSKKQYVTYGLIYMITGILLIALSVNMFLKPSKDIDFNKVETKTAASCTNKLNDVYAGNRKINLKSGLTGNINYSIKYSKKEVNIASRSMVGGLDMLRDADAMLAMCPGMKMTKFCMGADCKPMRGFNMTLQYNGVLE